MAHEHPSQTEQHHPTPIFRFCPKCGGSLGRQQLKTHEPERLVCTTCTFIFYDDPKVAACTVPIIDGKIVLLKRGIEPSYGKWVFPGGFLDRGERVEDCRYPGDMGRSQSKSRNLKASQCVFLCWLSSCSGRVPCQGYRW